MRFYLQESDEVFRDVGSSPEGLSTAEAEKRLAENGKNKLKEARVPAVSHGQKGTDPNHRRKGLVSKAQV